MKSTWRYVGLCAYGICICPIFALPFLFVVTMIFLYRHQGKWCFVSLCLLGLLWWRSIPQTISPLPDSLRFTVLEVRNTYVVAKGNGTRFLVSGLEEAVPDDVIEARIQCDKIQANRNFGVFDFVAYWQRRNVSSRCEITQVIEQHSGATPRAKFWQRIQAHEEDVSEWLKETLLHLRSDEETLSLITADGMYITLLLRLLHYLLSLWLSKRHSDTIALGLSAILAYLTSFRDTLVRIICFRLIPWLFPDHSTQDNLGISVLVLLFLRPYLAKELCLALPFAFRFISLFAVKKPLRLAMSALILIPLQFYYFHTVDLWQILLMMPLRLLLMMNYTLALFYVIFPLSLWYEASRHLLEWARSLDLWQACFYYQASFWFIILWYGILLAFLGRGERRYAWMLITLFCFTQAEPYLRPYAEVMMIDVGQGDCTLISLPFHQGNILIDAAGSEYRDHATDIIVPVLQARGIRALDLVIITHEDLDHNGALPQLQEQIPIKQIIRTKQQDTVRFGHFQFQFLLTDREFSDRNENSLITYFQAFDTTFLFMGDSGKEAEKALLKSYPSIHADVLKVGHHGSKSASSPPFIHQVHPLLGLISCGARNFYGHPASQTLETLENEAVHILDTPHHGAVSIKITNIFSIYKTATNEFGIISIGD